MNSVVKLVCHAQVKKKTFINWEHYIKKRDQWIQNGPFSFNDEIMQAVFTAQLNCTNDVLIHAHKWSKWWSH